MKITKAVITAAAYAQRSLALQTLIDQKGMQRSVLEILIEEAIRAHIEEICMVVWPGDQSAYLEVAGEHAGRITFVEQSEPLGYGHAVYCAHEFTKRDPFLHLVGDHIYVNSATRGCAELLVEAAEELNCSVSAVQVTRESALPYYGTVGGQRHAGRQGLYRIDTVSEKPTPTEAEQNLIVPGLRSGYYLCFFGMHVLTPAVMQILASQIQQQDKRQVTLSSALSVLAQHEEYLAMELPGRRFNVGTKYGLLSAQLALALAGRDREEVLSTIVSLVAGQENTHVRGAHD